MISRMEFGLCANRIAMMMSDENFGRIKASLELLMETGEEMYDKLDAQMVIDDKIVNDSIVFYGKEKQSIVCMEECSELIQAISKEMRGKQNLAHLTEEIADVYICLDMLRKMYSVANDELAEAIRYKQDRVEERIDMARMERDAFEG